MSELALLGRVLQLAAERDADLGEFLRTVSSSPRLAARVVQISNSALYGMPGKITRLERAVLILGVSKVAQITSTLLVAGSLRALHIPGAGANALWQHSLEIGACSELIARCLNWPEAGEAYLCGLLHDLGVLELAHKHERRYVELLACASEHGELTELERAELGDDHAALLRSLALGWGFPATLCDVVGAHHELERCPEPQRRLAQLLRAAHQLIEAPLGGWSDLGGTAEQRAAELTALGLDRADVSDVRALLGARLRELARAFAG